MLYGMLLASVCSEERLFDVTWNKRIALGKLGITEEKAALVYF